MRTTARPARLMVTGLLVALLALVAVALARQAALAWGRVLAPAPLRTDEVVVAVAAAAGSAVAAWLALGALASAVALLRGSTRRPALVPAAAHRAVALVLGVALAAAPTAPAPSASTTGAPGSAPPSPTSTLVPSDLDPADLDPPDLDPGWSAVRVAEPDAPPTTTTPSTPTTPTTPTTPPTPTTPATVSPVVVDPGWRAPAPAPAPAATVAVPGDPLLLDGRRAVPDERTLVTVRRGDTLWDLAARHLGPQATDAEIAAEWPRWHEANRAVVGDDPDLLLPGWQLQPPDRTGGNRP